RARGGIGRRARFRSVFRKEWWFDSTRAHHRFAEYPFAFSGEMAVAYFMVYAPRSFFPALNGGVSAILFCFVFLYFFAAGPGAWSLGHLWTTRGCVSRRI